jgi:adenylate cyclase
MSEEPANQATPVRDVFVSYASRDAAIATSIVENLERQGIRCWIAPRDVTPGSQYADEIVGAINGAKVVVLVLSEHAVASPHVGKEIERASSKRRRVIALRTDAAALTRSFEYFLSESQWIDVAALGMPGALTKLTQAVGQALAPASWVSPGLGADARNPADRSRQPTYLAIRRVVTAAVFLVVAAIVVGVVVRYWPSKHGNAQLRAVAASSDKSIAVLPFTDLSEKKDQEYFADGLSEELVGVLGKLPNLRVIAHTSSFQLRGKGEDPHSVGTQLNTAHVVLGSVRRAGNRVRVTAQLVRSSDGAQEWSDTYDRSVDDILQVQTEIAASLGRALQLSVAELQETGGAARPSAEAYDLYLRGLHANDRISNEGFAEASSYLQRAIELDPQFVRAHEQLASTHLLQAVFGAVPADTGFGQVRDDAANLLKLDPGSGWGQTLMCRFHTEYSWNWPEAEHECASALEVAPRFWLALYAAGDLALIRGDYAKSERLFREIFPIDPLNADTYMELGLTLGAVGRIAEAEAAFRRGLAITPTYITGHIELGSVLLAEGRIEDARQEFELGSPEYGQQAGLAMVSHARGRNAEAAAALEHFIKDHGETQPMTVAEAYSYFGDADHAFDWLARAYRQKDPLMPYIKSDWLMRGVEHDARYQAFLKKMNLSE